MNTPRYATAAAKLIAKHLPRATPDLVERERSIATIERAIRARTRRRRWLGVGSALAVAAALLLVAQITLLSRAGAPVSERVLIKVSPSGKGAALQVGDVTSPVLSRVVVETGQRIETPVGGGAALQLSTGTSMTLAGSTAFRVDSQSADERFSLQRGELSAHVAKLTHGQRFIVTTPDAEVEVRGTRFRLSVLAEPESCGAGTRTRLEVSEGVVEIRTSGGVIDVKAGESWPVDCNAKPQAAPANADELAHLPASSVPSKHGSAQTTPSTPSGEAEHASALAAANDLFAEGVAKRRQGDVSGALRAYRELLTRFPRSALAENALVERMRLLASTGDSAKATEAKRYLARYPGGFAVKEAQRLAAEP
jgi:ferric-dicitrate binding protein FerR (iron transport regulator)